MSLAESTSRADERGGLVTLAEGRRLRAVLAGPRAASKPLVVLEAGAFGFSADWDAVQGRLAARGLRSLAYDRAGLGFSDPGPAPRDGIAIASDLEALLAALGEGGRLVLCGHSMAGLHARVFTARNRRRVAGLVLVDATTPEMMDARWAASAVEQFGTLTRLAAWGAEAGLLNHLAGAFGDAIGLEGAASAEKRWAFAHGGHNRWAAAEVAAWASTALQARQLGDFPPDLPIAVVLPGRRRSTPLRASQLAPAERSRAGFVRRIPGASHATLLGDRHADEVVAAIADVLGAVRPSPALADA